MEILKTMELTKKELLSLVPGQKVYLKWDGEEKEEREEVIVMVREEDSEIFYYSILGMDGVHDIPIKGIGEEGRVGNGYFWIGDNFRVYKGRVHETIDCTPTWESVIDIYINAIEYGNYSTKESARQEIRRIAKIADEYNKLIKAANK